MQSAFARSEQARPGSRSTASTEPLSWKSLEQRSKNRFTKPKLTKTLSGSLDSILTSMGLDIKMRFTTTAVKVAGRRGDGEIDNHSNGMPKQILVELPGLANLSNATDVSADSQTNLNNASRFTKRSQVMTARATTSASTELTATLTSNRGAHSSTSQANSLTSQLHNFSSERRMSNTAAVRSLNTHADASPPLLAKAKHQDRASSPSSHVRDLAKNFDAFKTIGKKNGMDKVNDHRDERNRMQLDLGKTNGDRHDSNVKIFEQKQSFMSSNKKLVTNDFSTEEAIANRKEMTHLREGDNSFKENKVSSDMRACLEMNGIHAEKGLSSRQEDRRLKVGDIMHYETSTASLAKAKLSSDSISAEQMAIMHKRKTLTANSVGVINKEERNDSSLASRVTLGHHHKPVDTPTSPAVTSALDELGRLEKSTNPLDVNQALIRCGNHLSSLVHSLNSPDQQQQLTMFDQMGAVMQLAWSVPDHGYQLGVSLSNTIRQQGGLDTLISSCDAGSKEVERRSARVLSNCLTTENRQYVVERGLIGNVVRTACRTCTALPDSEDSRVGAGILQSLFKHSEGTCSDVVRMGGLDAVLTQCKNKDVPTLRHCAVALANLSLYGGPENQQTMLKRKVPTWLFPLAFHNDDGVKYYACLAIAAMVANKEIEAAVLRSGTLELVEPFVTSHDPAEFAKSAIPSSGHSKSWLKRLVPILLSDREEARKLAAFHFCMEAGIKVEEGCAQVFDEIGAIEPLRQVASSPNAVASKFAAQALFCLGEEVPIKLSQQVPLWSVDDVANWVQQIDFAGFKNHFINSRVDGDLLFRLNEEMLKDDIGMANGILRKRFMRELNHLKQMADYSSCDTTQLYQFLQSLGAEFSIYTYSMLVAGVDKTCLRFLTDDQLQNECGVNNSIHRLKIHEAIKQDSSVAIPPIDVEKTLDCFISYRRSNGSQLASLLKVHLELRGFSVFIDVERLEAGKFGNNLLNSIYQASNFILVLTPCALDRCIQDSDQKDWVRKEINAALKSKCNIVPIIDDFQWPEPEKLPEDMRPICKFNGIRWIHDYQEACVDKLERFMRGEFNRPDARLVRSVLHTLAGTSPSVSRCHSPAVSRGYVSPLLPRRRAAHPPLVMKRSRSLDGQTAAGSETYLRVPHLSGAGFQPTSAASDDDHSEGHSLYYHVDPYCGQNSDASGSSRDW